jgi:DNA-binding MarR family transcriptional regulator
MSISSHPTVYLPKLLESKLTGRRAMILWLIREKVDDNMTLASRLAVSRSLISHDLGALADGGWIERPTGFSGRAARTLKLTKKGRRVIQALFP